MNDLLDSLHGRATGSVTHLEDRMTQALKGRMQRRRSLHGGERVHQNLAGDQAHHSKFPCTIGLESVRREKMT